jgi:hypothetical protein
MQSQIGLYYPTHLFGVRVQTCHRVWCH